MATILVPCRFFRKTQSYILHWKESRLITGIMGA